MMAGTLADIAQEILDATRVVTDAADAAPGKPVRVTILPGLIPQAPTDLSGAIGLLTAVIHPVTVSVTYTVSGGPPTMPPNPPGPNFQKIPLSEVPLTGEPLDMTFLLRPPIGDDTAHIDPAVYKITVNLTVNVDGNSKTATLPIAVSMPPLGIPAIVVLSDSKIDTNGNFKLNDGRPNTILVMVKGGSALRDLGAVVSTINKLSNTLNTLETVLGWGAAFTDFTGVLSIILSTISDAPLLFFSIGNARDFGNYANLDDDADAWLILGVAGTQATIHDENDFDGTVSDGSITADDIGTGLGIATGVGLTKPKNRTDNSGESARFGGSF